MPEREPVIDAQGQGQNRLTEEEAHEEANLVRGNIARESAKWPYIKSQSLEQFEKADVTPEDYTRALQAVEELKDLAEKEPVATKVTYVVGRMLHYVARIPGADALFITAMFETALNDISDISGYKKSPLTDSLANLDKWLKDQLTDASKKFAEVEKLGKAYGKSELKRDVEN